MVEKEEFRDFLDFRHDHEIVQTLDKMRHGNLYCN